MTQALLEEGENNYLAVAYMDQSGSGEAYCALSTGEIGASEFNKKAHKESLLNELMKLSAKEV